MAERPDKTSDKSGQPRTPFWLACRALGLVLLSYFGLVMVIKFFENRFVYLPTPWPQQNDISLSDFTQDVTFNSDTGVPLHAWRLACPHPRAHVLFLHGNAGNLAGRQSMLEELHDAQEIDLFAFDYRGYGKSHGRPSEAANISDARTARRVYATLAGIPESEVVLMGRSLGGGVAVGLAAEDGARGLILQSTFTSLPDMAARQFPWLPVRLMMKNRYPSLEQLPEYHGPLLCSHSRDDTIVPFQMGRELFAAGNEPKDFFQMSGSDHNDPEPDGYQAILSDFIDSLP